ncbi:zinc finger, CCHC-type containing protein [Tanacetum coccineum]
MTTPMPELMDNDIVEAIRRRAKWENNDYICRGHILNGMSDPLFDIYQNIESAKELWDSLEFKYMAEDASSKKFLESLRAQESDKGKGKKVAGPFVNMTEEVLVPTRNQNWNVRSTARLVTSRGIAVVVTRKAQMLVVRKRGLRTNPKTKFDAIAWWIDSGATTHVCKDRCWFTTYEPAVDGSVLYMDDDYFAPVHRKRSVVLEFISEKSITLFNLLYVPKLRKNLISGSVFNKCGYKQVYESDKYILSKSGVFVGFGYYNNGIFMLNMNNVPDDSGSVYIANRGGEYYDPGFFQSVGIIHETTAPYTPQQNGVAERKNRALKEIVNSMLSYSGLSEGFWGEAMAVVRLPDPKRKILGEKGIDCIFVGYAKHSKAYRFYVIEPNDSVSINSIIESRDAIFDENRFSSIPRPKDIIPNSDEFQRDDHLDDVTSEIPEPRRGKRARKAKLYGSHFQLYLVEGSRDQIRSQYSYCYSIEEDPRIYNTVMQSRDVTFWKEAIDDEIRSIMENNTWFLSDLPPGCKPLGCKWIFKRKMKVDGTIDKFKARSVIQGFRQKEGIDYFDTYAPVARITTIKLLLALAAIHNLLIHQMDVKTTFLNGDLEEQVYMKQPEGFVIPGNEHKVCKLVKSLYGLKQAPKQWHQKFDEVVLSSGFLLNQSDKCLYSKFDDSGKGVIICLYVDDMLIFGTDQNQVDKTKKFLSSKFFMKDMGEADVILGIKIKHENKGIVITQSHYIEKILKKFNRKDCSPVSTPMDPVEKLKPNTGKPVDQLEYSRAIGCLMYDMTSTRLDIAYAVGRLNKFTSNPSRQHWHAITRVFKYLKGTMNYGLLYVGYPSVLEAYSDASWINHVEDSSSTSGSVFLLGGGAISWASKKQICISDSTMESELVALAAVGKEAEWLRNLMHEILIWPKLIAPISIHCDSAATLAKAYSQIYNGKSRHLGVRHSMIRELIMNGVISIEFVRSQHNLADHLTKGLARDLVIKSLIWMGLKSI